MLYPHAKPKKCQGADVHRATATLVPSGVMYHKKPLKTNLFTIMKADELELLKRYFPESAVAMVGQIYEQRRFNLHFKRPRSSKLGDFRPPRTKKSLCTITLNLDLNPYQMLITYIHEVAHYDVYQQYGLQQVQPHGTEWQSLFSALLQPFMVSAIFPQDVLNALKNHLQHIKASSTADVKLQRVLQQYDTKNDSSGITVESLPVGARFLLKNGMVFQKGEKQRTRYKCHCETNGKTYMVAALAEAKPL